MFIVWISIIQMSRIDSTKIRVHNLSTCEFFNVKDIKRSLGANWRITRDENVINWKHIRDIKVSKENNLSLLVKEKFSDTYMYAVIDYRLHSRGRPVNMDTYELINEYDGKIPIATKKYNDLLKLCSGRFPIIPPIYHEFYTNLPHSGSVRDRLPAPDVLEHSSDEDLSEDEEN